MLLLIRGGLSPYREKYILYNIFCSGIIPYDSIGQRIGIPDITVVKYFHCPFAPIRDLQQ